MTELPAMGGYAWYLCMAFGAVALAVTVETITTLRRHRRARIAARAAGDEPRVPAGRLGSREA